MIEAYLEQWIANENNRKKMNTKHENQGPRLNYKFTLNDV